MRRLPGVLWAALDHKWLSRVSNATWIVGGLWAAVNRASDKLSHGAVSGAASWVTDHLGGDRASAVALLLVAVGLIVRFAVAVARWRRSRSRRTDVVARPAPIAGEGRASLPLSVPSARHTLAAASSSAQVPVSAAVRDSLLRECRAGERLVVGNQRSPIRARMSAASRMSMLPVTTAAAVEQWEKRVVHLLHRAERWELADYFLADVPAPPTPTMEELVASSRAMSATAASMKADGPWNPELGRRLDFRLTQLNTILKREL